MQSLVSYIFIAMLSWIPVRNLTPYGETEDQVKTRLHSIAEDIVTVALDVNEPPVFGRSDGRVKTALLQAAIASMETGYQKFVDEGACNRRGYVADRRGDCDGGHAFSMWQIHVAGNGYILLEDGTLTSKMYATPDMLRSHPVIGGAELVADRKTAIRVAQRIERDSLKNYHSLCRYSGESCEEGAHPKAAVRLDRAVTYYASHPFTDAIPEPVAMNTTSNSASITGGAN